MEVYVPYVLGSTITAFIGRIAYNYYATDEVIIEEKNIDNEIDQNDYDLLIGTNPVNNNKRLDGVSFKDKSNSIRNICRNFCGFEISDSTSKKNRGKLLRYIKEYETIGHDNFVRNHKKKTFKNNLN